MLVAPYVCGPGRFGLGSPVEGERGGRLVAEIHGAVCNGHCNGHCNGLQWSAMVTAMVCNGE